MYKIALQSDPRRTLYTFKHLAAARRGAQIVANARNAYTMLWHDRPDVPFIWSKRDHFAPEPEPTYTKGDAWTRSERERRQRMKLGYTGGAGYVEMRAYLHSQGRNAAAVLSGLRVIYSHFCPLDRLTVEATSHGHVIFAVSDCKRHVARLTDFMRAGAAKVEVCRSYNYAWRHEGGHRTGAFSVRLDVPDSPPFLANTSFGAHEVTSFPPPEHEKRSAQIQIIRAR